MQSNGVLVRVGSLLPLSVGDSVDTTHHRVPTNGGIAQVGQVEGTINVAHRGEGTTSIRVGLFCKYLVDGPCDGGVRGPDEAMLRRGGGEHRVEILDQGEHLRLGMDGGEASVPMGNRTHTRVEQETLPVPIVSMSTAGRRGGDSR